MTVDEVHKRVAAIREASGDDEVAHLNEDGLWEEVLTAIAEMGGDTGLLASAALETKAIDFSRWYA